MSDGSEPVTPNEILYRRVPPKQVWFDPNEPFPISHYAFCPQKEDLDGISLSRGKYSSAEQAAASGRGAEYYIAEISADAIFGAGLTVIPDPKPNDPGHCLIRELNRPDYDSSSKAKSAIQAKAAQLSDRCIRVAGPHPGTKSFRTSP